MSKILDLSLAVNPNIALFTAGTIDFLQASYAEGIKSSIISQIGLSYDITKVYLVYGCLFTGHALSGTFDVTEGCLFFNGEFYISPAQTNPYPLVGTFVADLQILPYTTSLGGDPMVFTVSGSSNVHNIRQILWVNDNSGTGTLTGNVSSDIGNMIRIKPEWIDAGTSVTAVNTVGGGTFTVGTVSYNKYIYSGKFFKYQLTLKGCSVSGTVGNIQINLPTGFSSKNWVNAVSLFPSGVDFDLSGTLKTVYVALDNTGGSGIFTIQLQSGAFITGSGNHEISLQLEGELS